MVMVGDWARTLAQGNATSPSVIDSHRTTRRVKHPSAGRSPLEQRFEDSLNLSLQQWHMVLDGLPNYLWLMRK
jgi:hypothetical protein